MDIRVLRYFLMVAQEESFSRAAERLFLSQPTLSRQIHELETELGVTLLKRTNRNVILTSDGQRLRKRAQEIVELADKTRQEFAVPTGEVAGDIYIGGGETHVMRYIAQTAVALRRGYSLSSAQRQRGRRFGAARQRAARFRRRHRADRLAQIRLSASAGARHLGAAHAARSSACAKIFHHADGSAQYATADFPPVSGSAGFFRLAWSKHRPPFRSSARTICCSTPLSWWNRGWAARWRWIIWSTRWTFGLCASVRSRPQVRSR